MTKSSQLMRSLAPVTERQLDRALSRGLSDLHLIFEMRLRRTARQKSQDSRLGGGARRRPFSAGEIKRAGLQATRRDCVCKATGILRRTSGRDLRRRCVGDARASAKRDGHGRSENIKP